MSRLDEDGKVSGCFVLNLTLQFWKGSCSHCLCWFLQWPQSQTAWQTTHDKFKVCEPPIYLLPFVLSVFFIVEKTLVCSGWHFTEVLQRLRGWGGMTCVSSCFQITSFVQVPDKFPEDCTSIQTSLTRLNVKISVCAAVRWSGWRDCPDFLFECFRLRHRQELWSPDTSMCLLHLCFDHCVVQ